MEQARGPMCLIASTRKPSTLQRGKRFPVQARRIDTITRWQISGEFAQALAELTGRAHLVAALAMIATDRQVNEGLQKQPARSPLGRPCRFQHFVADKELTLVEEIDAPL